MKAPLVSGDNQHWGFRSKISLTPPDHELFLDVDIDLDDTNGPGKVRPNTKGGELLWVSHQYALRT
jgi:hypothetical protein